MPKKYLANAGVNAFFYIDPRMEKLIKLTTLAAASSSASCAAAWSFRSLLPGAMERSKSDQKNVISFSRVHCLTHQNGLPHRAIIIT